MIQGGDPTGTGRGGESVFGGKFDDEINPALKHTGAGILSMANSGPNTNGSQFFITLAPTPWLDGTSSLILHCVTSSYLMFHDILILGKHTIFGRIHSGMKIIQRIGSIATDPQDKPLDEIRITGVRSREAVDRLLM